MTIEEKRERLSRFCDDYAHCRSCILNGLFEYCDFYDLSEDDIEKAYKLVFPEEINHPDRYAGGKFECIDVMIDVFGADAVKHFCILNAFKYLWRAEKKNGVEDIKKAVFYLNKFIELRGEGE